MIRNIFNNGGTDSIPTKGLYVGLLYYNTDLKKYIVYNGTNWTDLDANPYNASRKGTTAQRPTGVQIGFTYKDTDLNKWIIWNGEAWENIDGTALI